MKPGGRQIPTDESTLKCYMDEGPGWENRGVSITFQPPPLGTEICASFLFFLGSGVFKPQVLSILKVLDLQVLVN